MFLNCFALLYQHCFFLQNYKVIKSTKNHRYIFFNVLSIIMYNQTVYKVLSKSKTYSSSVSVYNPVLKVIYICARVLIFCFFHLGRYNEIIFFRNNTMINCFLFSGKSWVESEKESSRVEKLERTRIFYFGHFFAIFYWKIYFTGEKQHSVFGFRIKKLW